MDRTSLEREFEMQERSRHHAPAHRAQHQLRGAVQVHLLHNPPAMGFHRVKAPVKTVSNILSCCCLPPEAGRPAVRGRRARMCEAKLVYSGPSGVRRGRGPESHRSLTPSPNGRDLAPMSLREKRAHSQGRRGFFEMSVAEIAKACGTGPEEAALAKLWEYDEPFLILDEARARHLLSVIREGGETLHLKVGRFCHITRDNDKAKAASVLIELCRGGGLF